MLGVALALTLPASSSGPWTFTAGRVGRGTTVRGRVPLRVVVAGAG